MASAAMTTTPNSHFSVNRLDEDDRGKHHSRRDGGRQVATGA